MNTGLKSQIRAYGSYLVDDQAPITDSDIADLVDKVHELPAVPVESVPKPPSWVAVSVAAALVLMIGAATLMFGNGPADGPTATVPMQAPPATSPPPSEDSTATTNPTESHPVEPVAGLGEAPIALGFTGASAGASIGSTIGPVVEPSVGPTIDPTGTVVWTHFDVARDDAPDPHIMAVQSLVQGGYVAYSAYPGGFAWYSTDGATWVDVTDDNSFYTRHLVWGNGLLAASSPPRDVASFSDENWGPTLWLRDGDRWVELDTPKMDHFSRPVNAGDMTLIVGSTNSDWASHLIIGAQDQYSMIDVPWDLPAWVDGDGTWQDSVVFGSDNGTFAVLVSAYSDGEGPIRPTGPTQLWISADGIEWSRTHDVPFDTELSTEFWTKTLLDGQVDLVIKEGFGLDPLWMTHEYLGEIQTEPSGNRNHMWYGARPDDESPIEFAEGLVIGGDPFRFSNDAGLTWIEIGPDDLGGPLVPFSENGIAGDLLFSSGSDGLWIGVAN